MPVYNGPIRDIRFVLHEVLSSEALTQLPGCEDVTPDLVEQVLVEGGRLCEEVLFPLNQEGDRTGCRFENGEVITPRGFRQAYQAFVDGGWNGLAAPLDYGGQGLPQTLYFAFVELMCSANLSFGMYPGLTQGACHALQLHGSPELKARFLPPLIAGTWAGTMCLTEPQCGTDLGLIRTRAVPDGAGGYKITGTKIFITAGDHDLTPNIVHLVLARLPDAPAGTRGISLFLVPKFLPAAGSESEEAVLGPRNRVTTTGIEHKMGIRGSSTCALAFDEATGWLVGGPHQGMRAMFTMMNAARLAVGLQGLGMAEIAYQNARAYARERLQGRALGRPPTNPAGPADPIIVHPDIRRHLMTMKAQIEAARMLALSTGLALDIQERHPDAGERARAEDRVAVLTPILKALLTDLGVDCAHRAIQIWGGHGYITDNGIEQYLRDARITQLYEGTNGIQALDLVGRKLPQDFGRPLRAFFHPAAATLEAAAKNPALAEVTPPVAKAFARLQQVTLLIASRGLADPNEAAAVATDYLRLFGLVALAVAWLEMIIAAHKGLASTGADDIGEHRYYAAKLATGGFFITKLLPEVHALAAAIQAGAGPVMALGAEEF